ncbi:MAG: gliding motility-associated C-terminal domain-containing protein [Bacteroidetes bacterium]|nr:gliding motility-associated C-terminal domain-containing protein [Bacteroidota bacterium]
MNDCFTLKGFENYGDCFSLKIFNRWGAQVLKSMIVFACWNGKSGGEVLPEVVTSRYQSPRKEGVVHLMKYNFCLKILFRIAYR